MVVQFMNAQLVFERYDFPSEDTPLPPIFPNLFLLFPKQQNTERDCISHLFTLK